MASICLFIECFQEVRIEFEPDVEKLESGYLFAETVRISVMILRTVISVYGLFILFEITVESRFELELK